MKSNLAYSRHILAMGDKELEVFVHRWVSRQKLLYLNSHEFGNANDLGRDVVGFLTLSGHDGEWDNYQCKMLAKTVDAAGLHEEIGKILFHAAEGKFTPPRRYIFVAPRGFSRDAERLLHSPTTFKHEILEEWEQRCARKVRKKQYTPLTEKLRAVIEAYAFENISGADLPKILTWDGIKLVLADAFGDDPGDAPTGIVPPEVLEAEDYVKQLVDIYSDHEGHPFADAAEVLRHPKHGRSLTMQRRRYFDAVAFRRHFRDNLDPIHVDQFNDEILSSVWELHTSTTGIDRLNKVMIHAGSLSISGIFGRHNRASAQVKQGTCHHLANEGVLPWKE